MNLENDLSRASALARLTRIIEQLRADQAGLQALSNEERSWFATLLRPFAGGGCSRLSASEQPRAAGQLFTSMIVDLFRESTAPNELLTELFALVRLHRTLEQPQPKFEKEDGNRILRLAESIRSTLIDEPIRPVRRDEQLA